MVDNNKSNKHTRFTSMGLDREFLEETFFAEYLKDEPVESTQNGHVRSRMGILKDLAGIPG